MKNLYFLVLIFIFFNSCYTRKRDIDSSTYYKIPIISKINSEKKVLTIKLDSIKLDSIESSLVGNFWINNDTLYFSDFYYNYVYSFDKKGKAIDRFIGRGKGPNEVLDFMHSLVVKDGYCLVSPSNSFVYLFDNNWSKIKQFRIRWDVKSNYKEILKHPNPKEIGPYELRITLPDMVKRWDEDHIAIAISATHPKFNGFFSSDLYYNYSRILALVNLKTEKIDELIGRRSPVYLDQKNIPNFDHYNFDLTEKELMVSFWPDSFIYVINKQDKKATGKFGAAGRNMRLKYPLTQTYEEAERNRRSDWFEYGHYSYLVNEPKTGLIFRGYTKGKGAISDGLQIYNNYQSIGDLDVPIGFKVIGSIGNEIFASVESERESSTLSIYKINLKYEN